MTSAARGLPPRPVAPGSGAVTGDLVGSGDYVAVVGGELDVFLVPPGAGRGRPLLRLPAGHIVPAIAADDLPAGWAIRAAGAAGTILYRGRLAELSADSPASEWVRLLSAAAGLPADGLPGDLAGRASLPVRYPASLRQFHRRALAAAAELVLAAEQRDAGWRAARAAANQATLEQAHTSLAAAAAGQVGGPGAPRTAAERASAVAGLLGGTVALSAAALAEAPDPVEAALAAAGLRHRPVRLEGRWWRSAVLPLVARRTDGASDGAGVVVLQPRGGRYRLADPAATDRPKVDERLAAQLAGDALQVYAPLGATGSASALIRSALRGTGRSLGLVTAAGLAAAGLSMAVPLLSARLLTTGLTGPGHGAAFAWYGVLIGAAVAGSALFMIVRNSLVVRLEGMIQTTLEPAVWARLLSLDTGFFARYSTGDLVQRANSVAAMRRAVSDVAVGSLLGAMFSALSLAALFAVNVEMAGAVLGVVLAALAVMVRLAVRQQRHELVTFEIYGKIYSLLYAFLLGIDKLHVAGREVQAFGLWARLFSRQRAREARSLRERTAGAALAAGIQPVLMMALVATAAWLDPAIGTGAFLAGVVAAGQFALGMGQWNTAVQSAFSLLPRYERMRPLLVAEPENDPAARPPGTLTGRAELKNVTFAYPGTTAQILAGVSVSFRPGEFAAIVGPSGGGKSTLVRLLLGFERPRQGQVLYDGRDLTDLDIRQVRRQIGAVLQHARVMRGSVLDNITGAVPGVTEDDAWRAAELAGLDDDIARMPMRMHTTVSEDNSSFSGGQLQRLLIARALVKRPRIILLDEATSALDNATQALVSARIAALDVTRVVVAHRLSTIRQADRIHVVEDGRITGSGTFTELAGGHELFARLVRRQEV